MAKKFSNDKKIRQNSSEVFALPEKRRKRGSLFSRKKKDKMKTKGQSTNCDGNKK